LFGAIEDGWDSALTSVSLEALEGTLSESELSEKVNEEQIKKEALQLIFGSSVTSVSNTWGRVLLRSLPPYLWSIGSRCVSL
jgi:hypothetical protein